MRYFIIVFLFLFASPTLQAAGHNGGGQAVYGVNGSIGLGNRDITAYPNARGLQHCMAAVTPAPKEYRYRAKPLKRTVYNNLGYCGQSRDCYEKCNCEARGGDSFCKVYPCSYHGKHRCARMANDFYNRTRWHKFAWDKH